MGIFRRPRQRHAMPGQQRLVGRHHRAAILQRRSHRSQRRSILAADQFHIEVDIPRPRQRDRIVEPFERRNIHAPIARAGPRRNRRHDDSPSQLARDGIAVLGQDSDQRRPDRSQTGDADPQRPHLAAFFARIGLHRPRDALPRFAAGLAPVAQVEDEQRIARDLAPEPRRGPPAFRDEGFD